VELRPQISEKFKINPLPLFELNQSGIETEAPFGVLGVDIPPFELNQSGIETYDVTFGVPPDPPNV